MKNVRMALSPEQVRTLIALVTREAQATAQSAGPASTEGENYLDQLVAIRNHLTLALDEDTKYEYYARKFGRGD